MRETLNELLFREDSIIVSVHGFEDLIHLVALFLGGKLTCHVGDYQQLQLHFWLEELNVRVNLLSDCLGDLDGICSSEYLDPRVIKSLASGISGCRIHLQQLFYEDFGLIRDGLPLRL